MKKLSKRERILLYALLLIGIMTVGLMVLIFPANSKYMALSDEIGNAKLSELTMRQSIAGIAATEANLKVTKEGTKKLAEKLYEPMTPEEADRVVTGFIRAHSLVPLTLNIDPFVKAEVPAYLQGNKEEVPAAAPPPEAAKPEAPAAEQQPETGDKAPDDATKTEVSKLRECRMTATFKGSLKNFKEFVSDISAQTGIRVTGYLTHTTERTNTTLDATQNALQVTVTETVYEVELMLLSYDFAE